MLAIDDEPAMIEWLKILLEHEGYEVRTAMIGTRGEEIFKTWKPDVVVTDMMLPDADGLELLRKFKQTHADTEVIVITGHGSVPKAVEAMKAGAHSFVEKPIEPDTLLAMLERAIERRELVGENQLLKQKLEGQFRFGNIVGKSKKMHELLELVESVAASDANILIQGENGTGKELIANAMHYNSKRAKGPFIKINCAAIPKDLIESELFGYKKGAFTGAQTDKEGLFEMAEGGSLLLDEIGEMPPYLQTKLLRVLQEREYRPIGSDRIVRVDFRLICATNIDLDAALRDGKLREDLYFRINTITLRVPPLRERTEDIPLLCEHFLEKYRQRHQRNVKSIAPAAYHLLIRHRWPGNVRELENVIERGVLVAKGTEITVTDLPESLRDREHDDGRVRDPAAPHAGGDREDGHPADAAAHQLEQAGSGADPRAVPADALQQDEEARDPGRRQERVPPRLAGLIPGGHPTAFWPLLCSSTAPNARACRIADPVDCSPLWERRPCLLSRAGRELFTPPFELRETVRQLYELGLRSAPLIAVSGLAVGVVLSMHTRASLERFGAESMIPAGLAIALVRETGPLTAGLLLSGRIGAGIGAELGAMRVTEQIDALEASAVDAFRYLVVTRVAACIIAVPLLTTIMNFAGMLGGFIAETTTTGHVARALLQPRRSR